MTAIRTELATSRKTKPRDADLVFGRLFTDHMAIAEWTEEAGWADARVVPYANFSLDPAAAVFHYGQEIFDGMKAFRSQDAGCDCFAPSVTCSGCRKEPRACACRPSIRR